MRLLKTKAIFEIFLIVMTLFFIGYNSEGAKAEDVQGCCKDFGNGQYCQNVDNPGKCSSGYTQTSCDYVNGCEQGCCNLIEKGSGCSKGVSKVACEKQDGVWSEGRLCEYDAECFLGCCVVGYNQGYMTIEDDCDGEFKKDIVDEKQCINIARKVEEGCCVKGKDCVYGKRDDCAGDFKNGKYCSSIDECGLAEHSYMDCGSGLKIEDVFWYDDRGNPEGAVKKGDLDSDGKPVQIDGDCDYMKGSICRDTDNDGKGDMCASLDCADTWDNPNVEGDGGLRKNGESWCEYQANVGPGKDLPGSAHYRHVCFNGKEVVEPCGSDRGEEGICVYHDLLFSNDEKYSVAACIDNTWKDCMNCGNEYCCRDPSKTCVFAAGTEGVKGRCFPLVPPENSDFCNKGGLSVKTFWQKKCGGSWHCKSGCEAYEDPFLMQTNSLCNLYGNCGAKYNLAGEFSNLGHGRTCEGQDCKTKVGGNDIPFENVAQAGLGLKTAGQEIGDDVCTWCGGEGAGAQAILWAAVGTAVLALGAYASFAIAASIAVTGGAHVGIFTTAFSGFSAAGAGTVGTAGAGAGGGSAAAAYAAAVAFVIIIAVLVALVITYIILKECGGTNEYPVSTGCGPYRPPLGGDDCWKCHTRMDKDEKGNDCKYGDCGLLPYSESFYKGEYPAYECTKQLCESLGSTCAFEQSKDGPVCISEDVYDVKAPVIRHDMTNKDFNCNQEKPGRTGGCSLVDEGDNGFRITNDLVDYYEGYLNKKWPPAVLKIKTDEYSLCKYSNKPTEVFENMVDFFDVDGAAFSLKHNMTFKGITNGTHKFYVRCEDYLQNRNDKSFVIEFSVASQPDMTPVVIENIIPKEGSYVRYGQKNLSVSLEINEPIISSTKGSSLSKDGSGCKWGREPNIEYDEMENLMSCSSSIVKGNECHGLLTDIKPGKNTFYFRCKDMDGNENKQDWPMEVGVGSGYNIFGSNSNLTISSIGCLFSLPDGSLSDNCDDILAKNFTLRLTTSGGAKSGNAECMFNGNDFYRTGGNVHEQCIGCGAGFGLLPGTYSYTFSCEDEGNNVAAETKGIVLNVDLTPPEVVAVYNDDSHLLTIETDEGAYCRYSFNRTFYFDKAKVMSTSDLLVHKADVENDFYRIGCKDRFDNYNAPFNVYLV